MYPTRAPRTARTPAPRTNRYAGKCTLCQNRVAEEAGVALNIGGKWVVQHNADECPPKAAPKAPAPQPEIGYYVTSEGKGIKVVEARHLKPGEDTKRRYGLVFTVHGEGTRPTWEYVKGAGISVADLTPMTAGDAARLGLAAGHCIVCCAPLGGKTLAAQVSAVIGYGATCAANNGWTFPSGVTAQRDFIARA